MVTQGKNSVINCRLPGKLRLRESQATNPVVVGDVVAYQINSDDTATITSIKKRKNKITRQSAHGRGENILVANIDQAFIITSIRKPKLKTGFIDRILVTSEAYGVEPVIIVNKMDLARSKDFALVDDLRDTYQKIGYHFLKTSIFDNDTIENLHSYLKGNTSVLIGPSGSGKTSLLNACQPGFDLPTSEVSSYSNKGTHTTTYSQLLQLNAGGFIVDTPGIRAFGLVDFEPDELSLYFPEMMEHTQDCKFNNCSHSHEPGCAVIEAFEEGIISPSRYDSYLTMLDALEKQWRDKY